MTISAHFERIATKVAHIAGRPATFAACICLILLWGVSGPLLGFSDTWQLIINTSTTIVTFLMVFLIQNTQNRDSTAIQTKLDELIRVGAAQNRFVGIENLSEKEIDELRRITEKRARNRPGGKNAGEEKPAKKKVAAPKAKISARRAAPR